MITRNSISNTCRTLCRIILLGVLLFSFAPANLPTAQAQGEKQETPKGITISLSANHTAFSASESVMVHVTMVNPTDHPIRILKWLVPSEDMDRSLFHVSRDGEAVPYIGRLAERSAPTEQDYMTIESGASLTSDIDLSLFYDLSVSGNYNVAYAASGDEYTAAKRDFAAKLPGAANSNILSLFVTRELQMEKTPFSEPEIREVIPPTSEEPDIVGGAPATPGEYPWQVALVDGTSTDLYNTQFCGGSLIDPQWVLTAAHCITETDGSISPVGSLDAVAGIYNLVTPTAGYQRRDVIQIVRHPSYDRFTYNNDIALLKLASAVTIGGSGETETAVIPLVPSGIGDLTGVNAWVTGWGNTESTPMFPAQLYEVQVPIIANSVCNDASHYNGEITANMLCAGYDTGGYDSCQGDSGGPLIMSNVGQWNLAGIVSWGDGCADPYKPGVYTRVSQYVSWVNSYLTPVSSYTISGNAGVSGATITYTGGSTTSDTSGNYLFSVPSGWSGTVTPTKSAYTFSPSSRSYSNVVANQADQNYTASPKYKHINIEG